MRFVKFYPTALTDADLRKLSAVGATYRQHDEYKRLCTELVIFSVSEMVRRQRADVDVIEVSLMQIPDLTSTEVCDALTLLEGLMRGLQISAEGLEFIHKLYSRVLVMATTRLKAFDPD